MIVNQQALQGIYVSFNTLFNKVLKQATPLWEKVATRVPSTTGEESYKWMGDLPAMREWIGDKQVQNLAAYDYTIKNKDFELTVGVKKNDIEDDRIGLYTPQVQLLAECAATFPDEQSFKVMRLGFTEKCFDKKTFYAQDHKVGKKAVSNLTDAKLTPTSYGAARARMMSITNESDAPLGIIPNLLVVPPALEEAGRTILMADQIGGTTNIYKGTAELLVAPFLAGEDTSWHLLCTSKAIKPFIYQERKAPEFVALDKPTDANVFWKGEFVYGAEARGNAGFSFWQLAQGSTGTGS